ncbi:hypothetical protein GAY28_38105, partial [Azospirillum brasilense]|nr:hypothetical protein [Azospirillum brasilense]
GPDWTGGPRGGPSGRTPHWPAEADCNPLWTATAVPAAHAAEAHLSREHRSRWRQADAIGIR